MEFHPTLFAIPREVQCYSKETGEQLNNCKFTPNSEECSNICCAAIDRTDGRNVQFVDFIELPGKLQDSLVKFDNANYYSFDPIIEDKYEQKLLDITFEFYASQSKNSSKELPQNIRVFSDDFVIKVNSLNDWEVVKNV